MTWVFPPAPQPAVPVRGGGLFPVRRIFCVGRNYAEHAAEMGADTREPPFFFTKPADALVLSAARIPFPPATRNLHHEGELVLALGPGGVPFGHAAGNDLTRRDLQAEAKAARRPWDMSKGFDNSAVVGEIAPGELADGLLTVTVDGETRQRARTSTMIWAIPEILAHLSQLVTLAAGDLIFTGTPAGVGELRPGQTCIVTVEGLAPASVTLL